VPWQETTDYFGVGVEGINVKTPFSGKIQKFYSIFGMLKTAD
jgi:hypothetical protein